MYHHTWLEGSLHLPFTTKERQKISQNSQILYTYFNCQFQILRRKMKSRFKTGPLNLVQHSKILLESQNTRASYNLQAGVITGAVCQTSVPLLIQANGCRLEPLLLMALNNLIGWKNLLFPNPNKAMNIEVRQHNKPNIRCKETVKILTRKKLSISSNLWISWLSSWKLFFLDEAYAR